MLGSWFLFFKIVSFGIFLKLILFSDQFSLLSVRLFSKMKKKLWNKTVLWVFVFSLSLFFQNKEQFSKTINKSHVWFLILKTVLGE